jgi:DNA-binding CsgD family transcriptional regulator
MSAEQSPKYYDEFLKLWQENTPTEQAQQQTDYEEQARVLGEYARMNKQFICLYHVKKQRVIYLSNNYLSILGYTCSESDYRRYSAYYWMRDLPLEQSWFFVQMSLFFKKKVQPILQHSDQKPSLNWYIHNFKLKPPKATGGNFDILATCMEYDSASNMNVIMLIIKDSSNYIRNKDTWWAEFRVQDRRFSFANTRKKFVEEPLLSEREQEVLSLIETGHDSAQIADLLSLSQHTVEKHRKNMLEKTGLKDSSSLLELARFGKLLG